MLTVLCTVQMKDLKDKRQIFSLKALNSIIRCQLGKFTFKRCYFWCHPFICAAEITNSFLIIDKSGQEGQIFSVNMSFFRLPIINYYSFREYSAERKKRISKTI